MAKPMLIDLSPDELYSSSYYYYSFIHSFIISMNRSDGGSNSIDDPFGRIHILNKMEQVNLLIFNMVKELNE